MAPNDSDAPITVSALMTEAAARAQLDDFGSSEYVAPLAAWVRDLERPQLSDFGRSFLRRQMVRDLVRRLRVVDTWKRHPDIAAVKLPPIVLIAGLPRTGTTLLHHLLALHDHSRALLRWELMEPTPPPDAASYATDPRIAQVQKSLEPLRGGLLERMHWVNADEPEECNWGYVDCTGLLGRGAGPSMPSWDRHIAESSALGTFEAYRKLIQLLLYKHPMRPGNTLVLKNPAATPVLGEFVRVFPEARIVVTHRDPYRSLISICTVLDAINAPFGLGDSPLPSGAGRPELMLDGYRGAMDGLERFEASHPGEAVHVRYADLTQDSADVVQRVTTQCFPAMDPGHAGAVQDFLTAQRAGKRVAPPCSYESYGYDYDAVWSDPIVARYCERYGVAREQTRIADVRR